STMFRLMPFVLDSATYEKVSHGLGLMKLQTIAAAVHTRYTRASGVFIATRKPPCDKTSPKKNRTGNPIPREKAPWRFVHNKTITPTASGFQRFGRCRRTMSSITKSRMEKTWGRMEQFSKPSTTASASDAIEAA